MKEERRKENKKISKIKRYRLQKVTIYCTFEIFFFLFKSLIEVKYKNKNKESEKINITLFYLFIHKKKDSVLAYPSIKFCVSRISNQNKIEEKNNAKW